MRPPVHQLEYFVAVAEEQQFTRAAERLHIAQPSVSAQVRQLERSLGTALFHRGPGPVTLTGAGRAILPLARRVLSDLGELIDVIDELDALKRGHVAIGATPSLSATLLPSVLGGFRRRYPGVRLTVTEQGSLHLVDGLEAGVLDVALAILPLKRPTLESLPLATEELVVVTSQGHDLAHRRAVAIADLRDVPLVMFRDGYDLRTSTLAAFSQVGLEPHIAVEGGEMAGVLALVAEGVGAAVVPSIVAIDPRLHVSRIRTPKLTRTIGLVRRQDREPLRAAATLFGEITKSLEDSGWARACSDGPPAPPSSLSVSLRRRRIVRPEARHRLAQAMFWRDSSGRLASRPDVVRRCGYSRLRLPQLCSGSDDMSQASEVGGYPRRHVPPARRLARTRSAVGIVAISSARPRACSR